MFSRMRVNYRTAFVAATECLLTYLAPDTYKPGKMCAKTVRLEDEKGPSADA